MATAFFSLESEEKEAHIQHDNEPQTSQNILNISIWVIGVLETADIKMPSSFHLQQSYPMQHLRQDKTRADNRQLTPFHVIPFSSMPDTIFSRQQHRTASAKGLLLATPSSLFRLHRQMEIR
ncbi:hypothetical protein AC781_06605 [Akkermansia glycaniphila]|nr:hypothetical protein AC781_06605 [Akkermansia glycaniphila]